MDFRMVAAQDLLTWAVLAFGLWLLLDASLRRLPLRGARVVAAALSWLVARAVMWWVPILLR